MLCRPRLAVVTNAGIVAARLVSATRPVGLRRGAAAPSVSWAVKPKVPVGVGVP